MTDNPREMLLKKCWPASTISSAENWSVAGGCVGIHGAGWMVAGVGTTCARPAPLRLQQQGERLQRAASHNPWNAPPLTLAYTRRSPTLTSCRGEVNGPLSSLIRRSPPPMGNAGSPDAPTGSRLAVLLQPLQHFLAMAAPVEVGQFSKRTVQSHLKPDQRSKINPGAVRFLTVEYLSPVLLAEAAEIGERRKKRGTPLLVAQRQKLGSRNAL